VVWIHPLLPASKASRCGPGVALRPAPLVATPGITGVDRWRRPCCSSASSTRSASHAWYIDTDFCIERRSGDRVCDGALGRDKVARSSPSTAVTSKALLKDVAGLDIPYGDADPSPRESCGARQPAKLAEMIGPDSPARNSGRSMRKDPVLQRRVDRPAGSRAQTKTPPFSSRPCVFMRRGDCPEPLDNWCRCSATRGQ